MMGVHKAESVHVEGCRLGKWEVQEAGVCTGERERGYLLTCHHPLNPLGQAGHQRRPPLCVPALMPEAEVPCVIWSPWLRCLSQNGTVS